MEEFKLHLKNKNQRLTKSKLAVLSVLKNSQPLNASEIHLKVTNKQQINLATIYRILNSLVMLELVQIVSLPGQNPKYELKDSNHHHHLICNRCGQIEEYHFPKESQISEVKTNSGFLVLSHTLEFFGVCKQCQLAYLHV